MKYSNVLVIALAFCSLALSKNIFVSAIEGMEEETAFRFVNEVTKAGWTGFMTGWYHSSVNKFIPTDACFGNWIEEDLVEMKEVGKQIVELDFMNMEFEKAKNAAVDVVELFFKQDEQCGFRKFLTDLGDHCEKGSHCQPDAVLNNLQKNAFQIVTKMTMMAELL